MILDFFFSRIRRLEELLAPSNVQGMKLYAESPSPRNVTGAAGNSIDESRSQISVLESIGVLFSQRADVLSLNAIDEATSFTKYHKTGL